MIFSLFLSIMFMHEEIVIFGSFQTLKLQNKGFVWINSGFSVQIRAFIAIKFT